VIAQKQNLLANLKQIKKIEILDYFPDGSKYQGEAVDGMPNGSGI